jgi:hypothetical protein
MPEHSGFGAAAAHQMDGRGLEQSRSVRPAQISASAALSHASSGFAAFRKTRHLTKIEVGLGSGSMT